MKTKWSDLISKIKIEFKDWNAKPISRFVIENRQAPVIGTFLVRADILLRRTFETSNYVTGAHYEYKYNTDFHGDVDEIILKFKKFTREKNIAFSEKRKISKTNENKPEAILTAEEKLSVITVLIKNNIDEVVLKKIMNL